MDRKNQKCDIRRILKYSKKTSEKKIKLFFIRSSTILKIRKSERRKKIEKVRTCICTYMLDLIRYDKIKHNCA